ncbi:hypothetical protein FJZ36_14920 [Candidatus Poribacteria bacterium]|nr:hypothetical protein [Candidatus Poribacteria bacterium]
MSDPSITWRDSRTDPVRDEFVARGVTPDLDDILSRFPRASGESAFDPDLIASSVRRLETVLKVDTGHPFLDLSVKTGLTHIDATFQGNHPKYGIKVYAHEMHDSFPPTIIAAVDALSAWGLHSRAIQLWTYWLTHFVRDDGTIDYYGPSISEYGQLLDVAASLEERAGSDGWWQTCFPSLNRMAGYLLRLCAERGDELIAGSPEADERVKVRRYFHNNAWVVKGLRRWADVCERLGERVDPAPLREAADALARDTLAAIRLAWNTDDWWLTPQVEPLGRPESWTATRDASYTNYRYLPELLSSGLLPPEMANRVVESRLNAGGQFCGMTRFSDHLDDWPLTDYLRGLWALGRREDFLLSLYGHVAYHQTEGHLTAYEQVSFPPGREVAAYCLPSQLVAARAARLLV